MRWSNVRLILQREVRDQLRDRRTLFMIAVLPLLLYPLLGMSFFQIAQFVREKVVNVLVVGATDFTGLPPLVKNNRFAPDLFIEPRKVELLELKFEPAAPAGTEAAKASLEAIRARVEQGEYDVALYFPPDFAARLDDFRTRLLERVPPEQNKEKNPQAPQVPSPQIIYNAAKESSQLAFAHVTSVVQRWTEAVGEQNLRDSQVSVMAVRPFSVSSTDVAGEDRQKAAVWAKILPFVVLLWALTGAFYPAVDLCAGEKERGTLETLLSSPAERIEIVWGKLLTIMLFSAATAILNLISMGVTGALVVQQLPNLAPPPLMAIVWLLVALVPMSALFSALCLALAAFARSTKEGQYYLMPLVLVTMPLTIMPMSPGVELNFGNSLIPVTGVVLELRALLQGEYVAALAYLPIVVAVTLGCCLLAIRWATEQFNSESVLFRESERIDVGLWVKHLVRDRGATPSVGESLACGVIILMVSFFMSLSMTMPKSFADFARVAVVTQLVVVLSPALLMTAMLTRSPRETLLLKRPRLSTIPVALLLAIAMHPVASALKVAVMKLYPIDAKALGELGQALSGGSLWMVLLIVAVVPAVCEELAFRGFILSGLRHWGRKRRAIIVTSLLFGATHGIFQQSILAALVGVLIGYLAVQTGSILPGMLFHFVHNTLAVVTAQVNAKLLDEYPVLKWLYVKLDSPDGEVMFDWPVVAVGGFIVLQVVLWLRQLPTTSTSEELLQERIDQSRRAARLEEESLDDADQDSPGDAAKSEMEAARS